MRVALISGLWPSKDENGLKDLAYRLLCKDPIVSLPVVYHYDQNSAVFKDITIAVSYSFGSGAILRALKLFPEMKLDLWIGLDSVDYFWRDDFEIPEKQVKRAIFLRRSWPIFPPSRLILNQIEGRFTNVDGIKSNHADFPRNELVVKTILDVVSALS